MENITIDKRKNEKGFFNLTGYLDLCNPNWRNEDMSVIINAVRNCGKSYDTWEYIVKEIWEKSNYTKRIAYLRTNITKLRTAREDFNSRYNGEYYMSDNKIYKITLDENGKRIRDLDIEVGSICGVCNAENYKSARFDNYVMIFWDEYNELNNVIGLWEKFIDLFKTIKRFNTPFLCLLIGNKVNANNDILVRLEIELPKDDTGNDLHIVRGDGKIHFIDISVKTFENLKQDNDIVNIWATYDEGTDKYLNSGGYIIDVANDVLVYRTKILPTREIKYYVALGDYKFEYGTFERGIYFHKVNETEKDYRILALNTLGHIRTGESTKLIDKDSYKDFASYLALKSRKKELFYSSFETKTILEPFILSLINLYE